MIKLKNVDFKYDKPILDNVNLEIYNKRITFIIGKNGSGKSTLANLISGLIYTKKGTIYLDDIKISKKVDNKIIRRKIGMVFQNPSNQILFSKVSDDIKFTLENMNIPKDKIQDVIKESLKKVDMEDYINENPYKLSGGEKQRIAIASQISYKPSYLIFDEATSMLDINGKNDIYKLIKKLKKEIGIIYITNDMNEIVHADDVVILDNKKVFKYSISDIIKDNNILIRHGLKVPLILKIITALNIKNTNEEVIIKEIKKHV